MNTKIKNTVFFVISNILIFLLLEIIFTTFFVFHSSQYYGPLTKFFFKFNTEKEDTGIYKLHWNSFTQKLYPGIYRYKFNEEVGEIEVKVNSLGFIGEEFNEKNEGNCRIISFGGSTTAGIEAKKSYPKILEEKLIKSNFDCEVLNFGFGGKGLNFLENLLVNEAVKYEPNIVTIMSNRNATMYDSFGNSSVTPDLMETKFDFFVYKINKFLFSEIMTYRFFQLVYKRIVSKFYNKENKIVSPYNPLAFHLKNYFTSKYVNQMTNILNFCREKGIKVVFIKQAYFIDVKYQKKLESLPNEKIIEKLMNYDQETTEVNKTDLFWIYTNVILNNLLEKIKKQNQDLILVDPTKKLYSFKKKINFLDDGLHLNIAGNKIIADEIMKLITEKIDLPTF